MSNSLVKWDTILQIASQSDVGMRRTNNQDNLFVSLASTMDQWTRRGHLFLVADGMGAHAAGELASKIAVEQIPHLYAKYGPNNPAESLHRAISDANAEIHRRGEANEEFHNMGTTCSSMLLLPEGIVCGHVGDSRIYRVRQNFIDQLTFDHSLIWEMRAAGQIKGDLDDIKIPKNVITRSLGPYPEVRVDVEGPFPVQAGDVYMLCTDGLTGQISDEELGVILQNFEPSLACQLLVDVSNLRGGPDNITIIILKILTQDLMSQVACRSRDVATGMTAPMVHPLSVVALIMSCIVSAIFFWSTGEISGAIVPLAVTTISLIWIIAQLIMGATRHADSETFTNYGRGPYLHLDFGNAGWPLVENFKEMISQITEASSSNAKNWETLSYLALKAQAEQAEKNRNLQESIRNYGKMVIMLMDQIRGKGIGGDTVSAAPESN